MELITLSSTPLRKKNMTNVDIEGSTTGQRDIWYCHHLVFGLIITQILAKIPYIGMYLIALFPQVYRYLSIQLGVLERTLCLIIEVIARIGRTAGPLAYSRPQGGTYCCRCR